MVKLKVEDQLAILLKNILHGQQTKNTGSLGIQQSSSSDSLSSFLCTIYVYTSSAVTKPHAS